MQKGRPTLLSTVLLHLLSLPLRSLAIDLLGQLLRLRLQLPRHVLQLCLALGGLRTQAGRHLK